MLSWDPTILEPHAKRRLEETCMSELNDFDYDPITP